MLGRMLKPFFPRGLYWRAALIVFVPVVTIMLVMSYVFIQRHYDGVTRQMAGNFVLVAREILNQTDAVPAAAPLSPVAAHLSRVYGMTITPVASLPERALKPSIPFYDLSGRLAVRELRRGLTQMEGVTLAQGDMSLWLRGARGLLRLDFPLSRISARNPHQVLVIVFAIGIVMSLISFIYLKNQMRPIHRLSRAAEAFGRGQILPLRVGGATEVRAAATAFLQMRERIERHIKQRTLLLSGVSHDLRTPLTRLRLGLSMLNDDTEAQALLADVSEMEALIDRFLEFARNEATEPSRPGDPVALVAQCVADAARGGKPVAFDPGGAHGQVQMRPQLLGRAVDNLISNGLRYGGKVRVAVLGDDDSIIILVEDNGPGIDPSEYELARRPFVRLDPARGASRGSGVGLGLAIVSDAMHSHGGRLELDQSVTPGYGGLAARLVLPRVRD